MCFIRYSCVLTGLQDVCHYDGERCRYRFLRMLDHRPSCNRDLLGGTGWDYSRYDIRTCGSLCSKRPLSILMALTVGNLALQLPSIHLTAYKLCVTNVNPKMIMAALALALFYGSPFPEYSSISAHRPDQRIQTLRCFWQSSSSPPSLDSRATRYRGSFVPLFKTQLCTS